jgi:hypothetical protein
MSTNACFRQLSKSSGLTIIRRDGCIMSRVTNVILTAHVGPLDGSDPEIDFVNKFLQETEGGGFGQFVEVSEKAGGTKYLECRVYLSAFNHADTNVILRAVDQAPWRIESLR